MDTSTATQKNLTAASGLLSTAGLIVAGFQDLAIQLGGTFVATLQFEGTVDNTTWAALAMHTTALPGTDVTSATATGIWQGDCGGLYAVRVRCSAYTSGLVSASLGASTPVMIGVQLAPTSGSITAGQVAFGGTTPDTIQGSSALTFVGGILTTGPLYAGGIIDNTSSGVFQVNASVNGPGIEPGFQSALGMKMSVTTTQDTSDTLQGGYFDVFYDINHNVSTYIAGQDFTNNIDILLAKTVTGYTQHINDVRFTGAGTISDFYGLSMTPYLDATQMTAGRGLYMDPPQLSGGAAIGTWYAMQFADISGLVVTTAKGLIDYASGKFRVDSAGLVTATGLQLVTGTALKPSTTTAHTALLQAYDVDGTAYKTFGTLTNGNTPDFTIAPPSGGTVTLQATTYKSSDGSSGVSAGPFTVITAIQTKNGLVTTLTGS